MIDLYDITVASYIRMSDAMVSVMEKSRRYFQSEGKDPDEIIAMGLYPDMWPFTMQIIAMVVQSTDALRALDSGVFKPKFPAFEPTFVGLQALLADNNRRLDDYTREWMNALDLTEGVRMETGDIVKKYDYLLANAIPNFYFHTTTAYDILRMNGAPIGKLDFLGGIPK